MSVESIAHLQQSLIEAIRQSVQDQEILNAFEAIPRREFIDDFFEFNAEKKMWECIQRWSPGWLEKVYTNMPLVTSINQHNRPNCSSSQPDIMAKMIQSLKLRPGKRVLEIGTGTGYNAALLGCLVGNKNVVTIDVNNALLDAARARIERTIGPGVTVLHADGRCLPETLGPFDALIVSASNQSIEPSWIQALAEGGRLIVNWNKSFSKVFFELEKQGDGLIGNVAPFSGDFMELHAGDGVAPTRFAWDKQAPILEETDFRDTLFRDCDFGFFLQIHIPALAYERFIGKVSNQSFYAVGDAQGRITYFSARMRGDASLWNGIKEVHERFIHLGKPRRNEVSLKVDPNGNMTFFHQKNEIAVVPYEETV